MTKKKSAMTKKKPAMTQTLFWQIIGASYALVIGLSLLLYLIDVRSVVFGEEWVMGNSVLYILLIYTIVSFQIVGAQEIGVKLLFGKPLYEVQSGLVFVPLGIFQLVKESRLVIQDELPGEPEKIFRNDDVEKVPDHMVPPIRIPFGYPKKESPDPLDRRITAEVVIIVRWRITNYLKFLVVIGSKTDARRQLNDTAVAMLFREFARVTPAKALKGIKTYNKKLEETIKDRVAGDKDTEAWGIHVESAQIKKINFSRKLNRALQSIPEESARRQATILSAEGTKEQLRLKGEGEGQAVKAVLKGRTDGFKHMAEELDVTPTTILGAETARAITENPGQKTVVVGPEGFANLAGTAAAVGAIFNPDTPPNTPPAEEEGEQRDTSPNTPPAEEEGER